MDIGVVSMRYARALIAYAFDEGVEDTLYQELSRLSRSYSQFPELRCVLDNPVLTHTEKFQLICTAANGENPSSKAFIRFARLVLDHHREFYLQFMVLTFLKLYRNKKGMRRGTLYTAVPIDDDTKEKIRKTAGEQIHVEMELDAVVDPAIEGGFIFDVSDFRLDASVAGQLKKVKQQFIQKNKRIV